MPESEPKLQETSLQLLASHKELPKAGFVLQMLLVQVQVHVVFFCCSMLSYVMYGYLKHGMLQVSS